MHSFRRLDELVAAVDEKSGSTKNAALPYLGLEHIGQRGAGLLGQAESVTSISTNSLFRQRDVLFGKLRPNLRKCALAPFDGYCSTDVLVLRPQVDVDPRFAALVFQSERVAGEAERTAAGTKMPRTSWRELRALQVFCPELQRQERIADVIDALDTTIRQTEAIISKLKQVKYGLLHDLLTRGIDANGELRACSRDAPQFYRPSQLGPVPDGWDVLGLRDMAQPARAVLKTGPFGSSLKGEHLTETGRPVVTIGSLGIGRFIEEALLYVSEATAQALIEYELIPGDIAFSRVADVGRSVVIEDAQRGWIMSSNFMRISVDSTKVLPELLQCVLAFDARVKRQVRSTVNSAGRDVASSAILMSLRFAVPTPTEQVAIVDRMKVAEARVAREEANLNKLGQIRAGLMDDLLTGRVRVTPLFDAAPA